ncbi:AcrR family transcriptional regulator [Nocardioides luteus]|uniref:TetR family transcriptional regulator n=1 Tax=Nocardioides luteus TaxID=1844 RepID=A0ABQ5T0Y0_9ACTN|nr:TetR/AcrR family transcriptional regulator [Nocardioides luteus]MDR7310694.1 AcrR family transcriptional regulator [Nocardioides luteus]GGR41210.1 TetR family transcriptional regulator [Nocardioides luteus]GLJ69525.1 TetR family transcriptional regulator [Nocardioides luteus]
MSSATSTRQAETVERLLAAGLEELREVGHEALTIRSVAARAGVSSATAYTYLASKNHLFVELFWRHLADAPAVEETGSRAERVQAAVRSLTTRIAAEPALAAAVTPALLGSDTDVERLRLRIGAEFVVRFDEALGRETTDAVRQALLLAFSGALLQAGMGLMTYDEMADRLAPVVAVIVGEE